MFTDWKWRRIPNWATYPTILLGLGLSLGASVGSEGGPGLGAFMAGGPIDHLAATAIALGVSYPLVAVGGMKAGDGKLLMTIGALRGTVFFFSAALYGAVIGGVLALILIALRRLDPPDSPQPNRVYRLMKSQIPYGVALGLGALVALAVELRRV